jgi:Gly-Xaa carboxypeptidase
MLESLVNVKLKTDLLTAAVVTGYPIVAPRTRGSSWTSRLFVLLSLIAIAIIGIFPITDWYGRHGWGQSSTTLLDLCPQADLEGLNSTKHAKFHVDLSHIVDSDAYRQRAIDWLSGAVKVPTESYDQMDPVGVDPRWETFKPFQNYLLQVYPLV